MNQHIIANPPCGIYKGDLPLGYAYYHTLLDIHSRFLTEFKGKEILCPKYSLNTLGKRAKNLGLDNSLDGLRDYVKKWIKKNRLRDKMNLSFEGELLDCSRNSIEQAQKVFSQLYEKGYILRKGDTFYLNVNKISCEVDLEEIVRGITFYPIRAKKEFERLIQKNKEPVRITKKRVYGAPNPLGREEISPIFVVSNLWEQFNQEIDLMASSEKELTRYLLLRLYSQAPLSTNLPTKNILVYNYINPEGGFEEWDVPKIIGDGLGSDSLRYCFAKSFSLTKQKTDLTVDMLEGGRRLVHLIGNLKIFFLKEGLITTCLPFESEESYQRDMKEFKYQKVLSGLEILLRETSKKVESFRGEGIFDSRKENLFGGYLQLIRKISPFLPFITNKVIKELWSRQT